MKKTIAIFALAFTVIAGAFASTNGTDGIDKKKNVKIVGFANGIYKLYYGQKNAGKVSIAIKDESGKLVLSEEVGASKGFVRPYNFSGMEHGKYTFEIKDGEVSTSAKIEHKKLKTISARKLKSGKVKLIVEQPTKQSFTVNIYDEDGNNVLKERHSLGFARVYDLTNVKSDQFTFEVVGKTGTQTVHLN